MSCRRSCNSVAAKHWSIATFSRGFSSAFNARYMSNSKAFVGLQGSRWSFSVFRNLSFSWIDLSCGDDCSIRSLHASTRATDTELTWTPRKNTFRGSSCQLRSWQEFFPPSGCNWLTSQVEWEQTYRVKCTFLDSRAVWAKSAAWFEVIWVVQPNQLLPWVLHCQILHTLTWTVVGPNLQAVSVHSMDSLPRTLHRVSIHGCSSSNLVLESDWTNATPSTTHSQIIIA